MNFNITITDHEDGIANGAPDHTQMIVIKTKFGEEIKICVSGEGTRVDVDGKTLYEG